MDKILAPIKQRVLKYIDFKGIEKKTFFEKINVSASNFRSKSLYSEISADTLAKISSLYQDVNPNWLLNGKGEMLIANDDLINTLDNGGENSGTVQRVKIVANKEGVKIGALETSIGASKGVLSRAIKNNTDIQSKWISRIAENYPQYNTEWLLTGKGDMIKGRKDKHSENASDNQIPIYDMTVNASIVDVFTDSKSMMPIGHLNIPGSADCDGSVFVTGDSMYPLLKAGDMVAYKMLNSKYNIRWGEIHVVYIVHEGDEIFAVKYLKQSKREGWAELVSYNDHHATKEYPIDSIMQVAHVKLWVHLESRL